MFTPRLRPAARSAVRSLRSVPASAPTPCAGAGARGIASRSRPPTPPPSATPGQSPFARRLLIGATAFAVAGLVLSQREAARNESASVSRAKGGKAGAGAGVEASGTPVYERESLVRDPASSSDSSSPAPEIVQRKEAEAVESTPTDGDASASASGAGSSANQGAFNEETGEINWDCPCLGGMADGPCGEDFKAAFSCFVYSEAEPKGVDCVEKFRAMQDCFRLHPDIYGEEIDDDDEDTGAAVVPAPAAADASGEDVGAVDTLSAPAKAPAQSVSVAGDA